jgi:hypothetical protein
MKIIRSELHILSLYKQSEKFAAQLHRARRARISLALAAVLLSVGELPGQRLNVVTSNDIAQIVQMSLARLTSCDILDSLSRSFTSVQRPRWALIREIATERTPIWSLEFGDSSFVILSDAVRSPSPCSRPSSPVLISAASAQQYRDSGYVVAAISVVGRHLSQRMVAVEVSLKPNAVTYVARLQFRRSRSKWLIVSFVDSYDM